MTEYEAASLVLQQSALALQKASLAAQHASVWVAAIVGAAQCSLIGYGLYIMRQAAHHRDALHQETMTQHRETMAVLKGQHEAQNDQHRETMAQHRENMAALESQHQETMKALEGQQSALMELIRRTSAPPARQDG